MRRDFCCNKGRFWNIILTFHCWALRTKQYGSCDDSYGTYVCKNVGILINKTVLFLSYFVIIWTKYCWPYLLVIDLIWCIEHGLHTGQCDFQFLVFDFRFDAVLSFALIRISYKYQLTLINTTANRTKDIRIWQLLIKDVILLTGRGKESQSVPLTDVGSSS